MNLSKKNDSRQWRKLAQAGAVVLGNAIMKHRRRGKCIVQFTKPMPVKEARAAMERAGYRPMTIEEAQREYDTCVVSFQPSGNTLSDIPHLQWKYTEIRPGRNNWLQLGFALPKDLSTDLMFPLVQN